MLSNYYKKTDPAHGLKYRSNGCQHRFVPIPISTFLIYIRDKANHTSSRETMETIIFILIGSCTPFLTFFFSIDDPLTIPLRYL